MTKLMITVTITLLSIMGYTQTETHTSTTSSKSISVSGSESSSVSINSSNSTLRLKAKFNKSKTEKVKQFLIEQLGKKNLNTSKNIYKWLNKDGFECKLSNGSLSIKLNKEIVSSEFLNKIENLTDDVSDFISGND